MTHDDGIDERERISRMEAVAYVESLLPELVTLSASQPLLRHLLQVVYMEAKDVVRRYGGDFPLPTRSPPRSH